MTTSLRSPMWIPSATRFPWPTPFIPLALAPWPHIAAFQFHHARPVDPAVNTQPIQHTPSLFLLPNCQLVTIISLSLSHFSQQNHYNLQRSANFLVFPFATFPSSRPSCFQNLTSPGFPFCFFSSFCLSSLLPLQISPFPLSKAGHGHVRPHRAFSLHHELHPLLLTTPRPTSHIHAPVNTKVNQSTACSYSIP